MKTIPNPPLFTQIWILFIKTSPTKMNTQILNKTPPFLIISHKITPQPIPPTKTNSLSRTSNKISFVYYVITRSKTPVCAKPVKN